LRVNYVGEAPFIGGVNPRQAYLTGVVDIHEKIISGVIDTDEAR
jgi:hypothetical protein